MLGHILQGGDPFPLTLTIEGEGVRSREFGTVFSYVEGTLTGISKTGTEEGSSSWAVELEDGGEVYRLLFEYGSDSFSDLLTFLAPLNDLDASSVLRVSPLVNRTNVTRSTVPSLNVWYNGTPLPFPYRRPFVSEVKFFRGVLTVDDSIRDRVLEGLVDEVNRKARRVRINNTSNIKSL